MRPLSLLFLALLVGSGLMFASPAGAQAPSLTVTVWELTALPGKSVPAPSSTYTLQLLPDGTVAIGADCNRATGVWKSDTPSALDITITLSSYAGCPAGSLEEPYLQALDETTGYEFDGDELVLSGPSGDLRFRGAPAKAITMSATNRPLS